MPWKTVCPMDEKVRFVGDFLNGVFSFIELCDRYGISRKTGYKWIDRYTEYGVEGLRDRSRKPKTHPRKTPDYIVKEVLKVRKRHPLWSPLKILKILERQNRGWDLPGRTTVYSILKKHGCTGAIFNFTLTPLIFAFNISDRQPADYAFFQKACGLGLWSPDRLWQVTDHP